MNPKEATAIIMAAGGDTEFGRLLGLDSGPKFRQRINNWKRRGIPARVMLDHLVVIESLRRQLQRAA